MPPRKQNTPKPPKKSEMLEVRLSYEDKQHLQEQAKQEGRSVSDIVRGLISKYLDNQSLDIQQSRTLSHRIMEIIMRIKNFALTRPKTAFISLALASMSALIFAPSSVAEDGISLEFKGKIESPVNNDEIGIGKRTQTFTTEVITGFVEQSSFSLSGSMQHVNVMTVTLTTEDRGDRVFIDMKLYNAANGTDKILLAEPKFLTEYNKTVELELNENDGQSFKLSIKPTRVDLDEAENRMVNQK